MPQVQVTLRPGYLARYVTLRVGKAIKPRVWEIQAGDANGFFTVAVMVDGEAPPKFKTRREGLAYLATLGAGRIWAEPRDHRPSAYVTPSHSSGGFAIQAARA